VRKFISSLLIASFIASPATSANLQAAPLGELLGARPQAAATAPASTEPGAQTSQPPAQDFQSAAQSRRGTVRFPILSKVIKLIIFVLLRKKK